MLPLQVAIALLAMVAAILLSLRGTATIVAYHLVFAVGIVPLILAAMLHFIPVLTRTAHPPLMIRLLPACALAGGLLVAAHFVHPLELAYAHLWGGALVAAAYAALAGWALRLRGRALGGAHPGLDWYLAAMACLLLALAAILIGPLQPGQRAALRLLHLHLNTLGFIGLTALGTLQVLLPTCAQRPDPLAATRLRQHLRWAAGGALLVAGGAAWQPLLAWPGLAMLAWPLYALGRAWLQLYPNEIFARHGAVPPLAAALAGYAAVLAVGIAHGSWGLPLAPVAMFLAAFLLPLVTGAVSQLLPVWLRPGRQTGWHQAARACLGRGGAMRALLFLAAGAALALGWSWGWGLAALGLAGFLLRLLRLARLPG